MGKFSELDIEGKDSMITAQDALISEEDYLPLYEVLRETPEEEEKTVLAMQRKSALALTEEIEEHLNKMIEREKYYQDELKTEDLSLLFDILKDLKKVLS
jgi:hypothetical protein